MCVCVAQFVVVKDYLYGKKLEKVAFDFIKIYDVMANGMDIHTHTFIIMMDLITLPMQLVVLVLRNPTYTLFGYFTMRKLITQQYFDKPKKNVTKYL